MEQAQLCSECKQNTVNLICFDCNKQQICFQCQFKNHRKCEVVIEKQDAENNLRKHKEQLQKYIQQQYQSKTKIDTIKEKYVEDLKNIFKIHKENLDKAEKEAKVTLLYNFDQLQQNDLEQELQQLNLETVQFKLEDNKIKSTHSDLEKTLEHLNKIETQFDQYLNSLKQFFQLQSLQIPNLIKQQQVEENKNSEELNIIDQKKVIVSCGQAHILVNIQGKGMYVCGFNEYKQLGLGDLKIDKILELCKIHFNPGSQVKQIGCGVGHSVILNADGEVFVCGINKECRLGFSKSEVSILSTFTKQPFLQKQVSQIAVGDQHTVLLDNQRQIYTCGSNFFGQLGIADVQESDSFQLINGLKNVQNIFCGDYQSFVILSNGICLAAGNNSNGELGIGQDEEIIKRFTQLDFLEDEQIIQISSRGGHTIIVLQSGQIIVSGSNEFGQLGINKMGGGISQFRLIFSKFVSNVKMAYCGRNFSVLLLNDGSVLTCGNNQYGQLGNGNFENLGKFKKIENLPQISSISSGIGHTICVASDQKTFYTFGSNLYGQLCISSTEYQNTPQEINLEKL